MILLFALKLSMIYEFAVDFIVVFSNKFVHLSQIELTNVDIHSKFSLQKNAFK